MIGDDPTPLSFAFNPMVIHIDNDWCHDKVDWFISDADTEIEATPESRENLINYTFSATANKNLDVVPPPARSLTRLLVCEGSANPHILVQSSPSQGFKSVQDNL